LELSMTTQQEYYKIVQDVQKLIEGKTSWGGRWNQENVIAL
jgi:hypothetical protein